MTKINICGIPHKIVEVKDNFTANSIHFGDITYSKAEIKINEELDSNIKKETLCHEIIHGILTHIGYLELADDERLVQALGNAIAQTFEIIYLEEKE